MAGDILVPQDRQRDVLAFELAVNRCPIRIGVPAMPGLLARTRKQQRLQRSVRLLRCNPSDSSAAATRCSVSRTVEAATPIRIPICRVETPAACNLTISRTWRIVVLSAGIGRSPKERP